MKKPQKKRGKKLTFEQKAFLVWIIAGVAFLAIALLIAHLLGNATTVTNYIEAALEMGCDLFRFGILSLLVVLIMVFIILVVKYVDFGVMRSLFHRIVIDFSNSMLTRNAQIYSYRIKYFLFGVLSRNNHVLHLPLGEDFSCLTPKELVYGCRDKCVFYNYDLIIPKKPEMDMGTLRKLIQSCIESELLEYHHPAADRRGIAYRHQEVHRPPRS